MNYMQYSKEPVIGNPEFGVFFFGLLYLIYRGLWFHALMMIILFVPTLGFVWIWYVFKTRQYLTRKYYLEGYFSAK